MHVRWTPPIPHQLKARPPLQYHHYLCFIKQGKYETNQLLSQLKCSAKTKQAIRLSFIQTHLSFFLVASPSYQRTTLLPTHKVVASYNKYPFAEVLSHMALAS